MLWFCFLFFKQKTAYEMRISDWSSDVCSSDLSADRRGVLGRTAVLYLAVVMAAEGAAHYRTLRASGTGPRPHPATHSGYCRWVEIGRASCRERVWQYV